MEACLPCMWLFLRLTGPGLGASRSNRTHRCHIHTSTTGQSRAAERVQRSLTYLFRHKGSLYSRPKIHVHPHTPAHVHRHQNMQPYSTQVYTDAHKPIPALILCWSPLPHLPRPTRFPSVTFWSMLLCCLFIDCVLMGGNNLTRQQTTH